MTISLDLGDLARLAREFEAAPARLVSKTRVAVLEAAIDVRNGWRTNATASAGAHGRHYPRSITARPGYGLSAEVGPQAGMKQAGMSFEYGSANQPPHLDGQRALDEAAPRIERRIEIIASDVL